MATSPFRKHLLQPLLLRGDLHIGALAAEQLVLSRPVGADDGAGKYLGVRKRRWAHGGEARPCAHKLVPVTAPAPSSASSPRSRELLSLSAAGGGKVPPHGSAAPAMARGRLGKLGGHGALSRTAGSALRSSSSCHVLPSPVSAPRRGGDPGARAAPAGGRAACTHPPFLPPHRSHGILRPSAPP